MSESNTTTSPTTSTLSSLLNIAVNGSTRREDEVLYATNITQLLLGLLIGISNALILMGIITISARSPPPNAEEEPDTKEDDGDEDDKDKPDDGDGGGDGRGDDHKAEDTEEPTVLFGNDIILFSNLSFAHCMVGIMLCVVNVMDGWNAVALIKSETSLVVIDAFISILSFALILLSASRYLMVGQRATSGTGRNKFDKMIRWAVILMWVFILGMMFVKALVFGFYSIGYVGACFRCYQVFEVVSLTLLCFALAGLFVCYCLRQKRASASDKDDGGAEGDPDSNEQRERRRACQGVMRRKLLVIGCLLGVFALCMTIFLLMYMVWLDTGKLVADADEILITLYFVHCAVSPWIIYFLVTDVRHNVKRLFCTPASAKKSEEPEPEETADEDVVKNGSASGDKVATGVALGAALNGNTPLRSTGFSNPSLTHVSDLEDEHLESKASGLGKHATFAPDVLADAPKPAKDDIYTNGSAQPHPATVTLAESVNSNTILPPIDSNAKILRQRTISPTAYDIDQALNVL